MPELPDVEVFRQRFEQSSLDQKIQGIRIDDQRILKNITPKTFQSRLKNRRFLQVSRHGKYLFAELSGKNDWLVMHFGMTGSVSVLHSGDTVPKDMLVCFDFSSGSSLIYASRRKLGQLRLIRKPEDFIAEKQLGLDPYSTSFDLKTFLDLFKDRKGSLKAVLMKQSLLAGIGNVYSDEILFQAGLHPAVKITDCSQKQLKKVYESMIEVLTTAVERGAIPENLPQNFLTPHRSKGASCPLCGGPVKRISKSGRSAYFCPSCQRG